LRSHAGVDASKFYAGDGSAIVDGTGIEMTANELLLGGKSGTITLSDSLSRVGSAKAAGSSAAAASPAPSAPSHALSADQVEIVQRLARRAAIVVAGSPPALRLQVLRHLRPLPLFRRRRPTRSCRRHLLRRRTRRFVPCPLRLTMYSCMCICTSSCCSCTEMKPRFVKEVNTHCRMQPSWSMGHGRSAQGTDACHPSTTISV
jgi:hypothetical protein